MFTSKNLVPVILLCTSLILYGTASFPARSEPLLLTPYIQQGNITAAQQLSFVDNMYIPNSYAGFITVDPVVENHLFFWFFPVFSSISTAPLLIWLNGGPGESSMVGLLLENGPLQLNESVSGETGYKNRYNSWATKFSMLYIDNPVGAGYSFSPNMEAGARGNQSLIVQDLYEFIKQFYQMFPEYLERDLYIGGQSYAGKYVPFFAYKVHQEIQAGRSNIRLRGIYLGGPLFDPSIQLEQLFDLYYNLGYIKKHQMDESKRIWREQLPLLEGADLVYHQDLMFQYWDGNFHTAENLRLADIEYVMNSDKLRSLLHVGNTHNFTAHERNVQFHILESEFRVSSVIPLTELMNSYKVLIFNGDLDGIISSPGLEAILLSLPWSSQSAYNNSIRVAWVDYKPKGFYTRVSNFCRVVIRGAGHRTSMLQPANTLEMMDQFVTHGCLS